MVTFIYDKSKHTVKASWRPRKMQNPEEEARWRSDAPSSLPKNNRQRTKPKVTSSEAVDLDNTGVVGWTLANFFVPPKEGKTRFHDLHLPDEIMHAIADLNFEYCMPIQARMLPAAISGQDVTGRAQTGTGKTASFLITIFTRLLRNRPPHEVKKASPRALVLAPTRELAQQIEKEARALAQYTPLQILAVYGGADYERQAKRLEGQPIDLIIATPGRLLDFKQDSKLHLNHVEILVIDEADRMLDMGFIPSVRRIIHSTPPRATRQTMLFSATLTPEVIHLASQWMKDAAIVEIDPEQVAVDTVEQRFFIVTNEQKFALLYNILEHEQPERVVIFANRRDDVTRLTRKLRDHGIKCAPLSGALPQKTRERTLEDFRDRKNHILIATDVAGRGLHVDGVSHVINYNVPPEPDDYVHRIGRTGRAGSKGIAISFASESDALYLPDIEKYIGRPIKCVYPEEQWLALPARVKVTHHEEPHAPTARRRHPPSRVRRSHPGKSTEHRETHPHRPEHHPHQES